MWWLCSEPVELACILYIRIIFSSEMVHCRYAIVVSCIPGCYWQPEQVVFMGQAPFLFPYYNRNNSCLVVSSPGTWLTRPFDWCFPFAGFIFSWCKWIVMTMGSSGIEWDISITRCWMRHLCHIDLQDHRVVFVMQLTNGCWLLRGLTPSNGWAGRRASRIGHEGNEREREREVFVSCQLLLTCYHLHFLTWWCFLIGTVNCL